MAAAVRAYASRASRCPLAWPRARTRRHRPICRRSTCRRAAARRRAGDMQAPPPVPLPGEPAHRPPVRPASTDAPSSAEARAAEDRREAGAAAASRRSRPRKHRAHHPRSRRRRRGNETEVEDGIRSTLGRATIDLNRIDYRTLNADARRQYDTAKAMCARPRTRCRTITSFSRKSSPTKLPISLFSSRLRNKPANA